MRFANPLASAPTTRRRTAIRAALLALLAIALLASGGSARAATGLIDETSYESPTYGYEVAWDAPWAADPTTTKSNQGADMLALATLGGSLAVLSFPSELTAEAMIATYAEGLEKSGLEGLRVVEEGEMDGVFYATVTGSHAEDGALVIHYEVREFAATSTVGLPILTLTVLASTEVGFEDNLALALAEVEIDGESAFLAAGEDDQDRGEQGDSADDDNGGRDRELADPEDDDRRGNRHDDEDADADAGDRDDTRRHGDEAPRFAVAVARNLT